MANDKTQTASGQNQELQVNADNDVARGVYSNMARIMFTKNEFILGFVLNIAGEAQLVSRVIVSPEHMENLSEAIQNSLADYKDRHGA